MKRLARHDGTGRYRRRWTLARRWLVRLGRVGTRDPRDSGYGFGVYVLDENDAAQPAPVLTWAAWMEYSAGLRIVARARAGDGEVSTVFLGVDHARPGAGLPVLWETMIFDGRLHSRQFRYTSRAAAVAGHTAAVRLLRAAAANTGRT